MSRVAARSSKLRPNPSLKLTELLVHYIPLRKESCGSYSTRSRVGPAAA